MTLLVCRGYEVIPASNGELGIELAVRHQPQLILLDVQLSSMDGLSVALALRCRPELRSIPMVAMTPHLRRGDREHTIIAGCNGCVEKPIDPATFVSGIEHYLQPEDRPHRRSRFWSWMARRFPRARVATLPS